MSVFLGLSVLLGYHVYLVLTASGTIEAMAALGANKAQKQKRCVACWEVACSGSLDE